MSTQVTLLTVHTHTTHTDKQTFCNRHTVKHIRKNTPVHTVKDTYIAITCIHTHTGVTLSVPHKARRQTEIGILCPQGALAPDHL